MIRLLYTRLCYRIVLTVLSVIVSTQSWQEVGVSLQVGHLEDIVPAGIPGTVGYILHWVHLEK
jgi:hypothetical protein